MSLPAAQLGAPDAIIHGGEILFSLLWLVGLVVVARTGATAIRLGSYLGATFFAVLWDWILGQGWFFRITFDDRLTPLYTLDGREEPFFAPLGYGLMFGTLLVVGLTVHDAVHRRLGGWTYPVFGLVAGVVDILLEGGVAISLLKMWEMDYDAGFEILNVPWTVPLYVAITETVLLFTVVTLDRLLAAARREQGPDGRDPAGAWLICLVLPAGATYLSVCVVALVVNSTTPW